MKNLKEILWHEAEMINDEPYFQDRGEDARSICPGKFGSQYPRMLIMKNGDWLIVYTVYRNNGYLLEHQGGNTLVIAKSEDLGSSWRELAEICDPGRDLDNGQLLELPDGTLLLSCRSVIWQQSYILPVYRSMDVGNTWERISVIDENSGYPGELGNPDRGVYEPHMLLINKNVLAVMYASEKHACEVPSYSQVIVEKISVDGGISWGEEQIVVKDEQKSSARPGMPVWDRLPDGSCFLVYEIIATEGGDVFYKKSKDGIHWENGIGTKIPMQKGGSFVLAVSEKTILVTSNTHHITFSNDTGHTWKVNEVSPWDTLWGEVEDNGTTCTIENGNVWPAMYKISDDRIIYITSVGRMTGGNNIQFRIGDLKYEEVS